MNCSTQSLPLRFLDLATSLLIQPTLQPALPPRKAKTPAPALARGFAYLYLMRNNRNGYYKIGYSKNPSAREITLQSEEPDITLIRWWPGTRFDETALHAKFAAQRIRGEWFKLSDADIAYIGCVAPPGAGSRMSGALDGHPSECAEWLRAVPKA